MSGIRRPELYHLSRLGQEVADALTEYFAPVDGRPRSRATLILPYLLGVLLDDLAQPANYRSARHERMVGELLDALRARAIDPCVSWRMMRFPEGFGSLIELTRIASAEDAEDIEREARGKVAALVGEIRRGALQVPELGL